MATIAEATAAPIELEWEPDALMERHSHLLGKIWLYAPNAPHSEWKDRPFLITTERGFDGAPALRYVVRAEHIYNVLNHIAVADLHPEWLWQE